MKAKEPDWLSTLEVIEQIGKAMEDKTPLSVVRVGDGENLCLAQYKVWPISRILSTRWARLSRSTNWKGVRLPDIALRERLIKCIQRADIVGIPHYKDTEILADESHLRPLTDACFERYGIKPRKLCHTFVNHHMVEYEQFWETLKGRRVAVISRWADSFKNYVGKKYGSYEISIVKAIPINRYSEINQVLGQMKKVECL